LANFVSIHPLVKNPPLSRELVGVPFQLISAIPVMKTGAGTVFGSVSNPALPPGNLSLPFGSSQSNIIAVAIINVTSPAPGPSIGRVTFSYGYTGVGTEDTAEFILSGLFTTITMFTTEFRDRIRLENDTATEMAVSIYFGTGALRNPPITT
jgi:hypothetical protein